MEANAKNLELAVPLPPAVEELLQKICTDQNKPPVDAGVRRRLAERGEVGSIEILHKVAPYKITKTLGGYILSLLDRYPLQPSPPRKALRLGPSTCSPNGSPGFSSPLKTVRYYNDPKEEAVIGPCSLGTDVPSSSELGRAEKEALGKLEFRKQFLILNYIGRNELHKVTTAEEITSLNDFPIIEFEARVWQLFGLKYADREDRRLCYDWDSGKTYLYDCHVCPQGSYRFKGPYLGRPKTHLQKVLGDDNILRVKFAEESNEKFGMGLGDHSYAGYSKIAREGVLVGLRRYRFFVFKDGGKEDKKKNPTSSPVKCYFIRIHSDAWIDKNATEPYILSNKTISEARRLFMHAHTGPSMANYMARFSLMLSKTHTLKVDLTSVEMKIDPDVYCKDKDGNCIYRDGKLQIHTDGTGEISEDLALLCPKNIHEGMCINNSDAEIIRNRGEHDEGIVEVEQLGSDVQEPPMLIQCRLFNQGYAIKGTFLLNKKLKPRTIRVRESMVKVVPDPNLSDDYTVNSLEIVRTSNRPKKTNLSRNLIALLSYGGVPDKFFKDLLDKALRETDGCFRNKHTALRVATNKGDKDSTIARMVLCGIPLEEPYLQHRLTLLLKDQKISLKEGKLHVPESYYLMGTADPTGELESDEVCIVLENGQVSGKFLVYRNPGLHFGDVHLLKAKYVEQLESVVGNAKYAIFFSIKGPRSVADEIGGGDFDGDMYWVSRNPKLLEYFKPSEPWIPAPSTRKVSESKRPDQFSEEEFEDELFRLFLRTRFQPSFAMGEAAESCQALIDRFLMLEDDCINEKNHVKKNIIKLIDLYYDALDAPKKGAKIEVPKDLKAKAFPHYMEKKSSFTSRSILGKIYDMVNEYLAEDNLKNIEIWKLPHFEVPQTSSRGWDFYYEDYRKEMSIAMSIQDRDHRNEAADAVKRKYRMVLYGAEEFEESPKSIEDIYNEALTIYNVCYDYARSQGNASLCSFAWSVAGSALCSYQISKQVGERAFPRLLSALRESL